MSSLKRNYLETIIGLLTIASSIFFVMSAMKITDKRVGQKHYRTFANFSNIEGIGLGTKIKIGGIDVGSVFDMTLNDDYSVLVTMDIKMGVNIPTDSILKISTSGIIGGKYLRVDVGGDGNFLGNGDKFEFTESAMDLEDMVIRFMLNKVPNERVVN
ncbi:hypothetical protein FACS1894152_2140 [Bacilli bacterium]|nr:hypothetical protein FACS1894152_2140 [Bacilli bacterium]